MIPSIFRTKALASTEERGRDTDAALLRARRISKAAVGISAAVGAFGGLLINLAFRSSFQSAQSGTAAFWGFMGFYAVCFVLTWAVYLRRATAAADPKTGTRLSYAQV